MTLAKYKKTYTSERALRLILDALRKKAPKGATKSELCLTLDDVSYGTVHNALMALLSTGEIERKLISTDRKGRGPYLYRVAHANREKLQ